MIERKDVIPMFQLTDMMDVIQEERCQLEKCVNGEEFAKHSMWDWMLDWLEKSDEEHLIEGMTIGKEDNSEKDLGNYVCHICFTPNRYFLTTSIPIDDGYRNPIKICASCGEKIGKLAEQLSLLKVK